MPESDQKPSAATRSKTQAFDLEALQLLVASTTKKLAALSNKTFDLEALQLLVASTTNNVAALSNNVPELKETSADTIIMSESDQKASATMLSKTQTFDLKALQALVAANAVSVAKLTMNASEIKETSDEINNKLVLEQEVHPNDDLQAKQLPPESGTRISGNFPPFLTSYGGIRTLVPEILSNRPSTTKNPSAFTNPLPVPEKESRQSSIDHETKPTDIKDSYGEIQANIQDILIADKINERHFLSVDMPKSTRASSNSTFPPFSTSYGGTHSTSSVTCLLAAATGTQLDTPFSPLADPFPRKSHSDAYGGTGTILVHLEFSNLQDHKEKLLLHDPTMFASSVANKEYHYFSKHMHPIWPIYSSRSIHPQA